MKSEHIIEIIESRPLTDITEDDLAKVRSHVSECAPCRRAFEATQVSALLLKEHAAVWVEPPAFFPTRVLATLRERQAAAEQWSWSRMWRASGALASSMVASVVAFAVLTFVIPGMQNDSELTSAASAYSAEEVILNQGAEYQTEDQVSDAQVLNTLYDTEEDK